MKLFSVILLVGTLSALSVPFFLLTQVNGQTTNRSQIWYTLQNLLTNLLNVGSDNGNNWNGVIDAINIFIGNRILGHGGKFNLTKLTEVLIPVDNLARPLEREIGPLVKRLIGNPSPCSSSGGFLGGVLSVVINLTIGLLALIIKVLSAVAVAILTGTLPSDSVVGPKNDITTTPYQTTTTIPVTTTTIPDTTDDDETAVELNDTNAGHARRRRQYYFPTPYYYTTPTPPPVTDYYVAEGLINIIGTIEQTIQKLNCLCAATTNRDIAVTCGNVYIPYPYYPPYP